MALPQARRIVQGDQHDWTWITPEGRPLYRKNPYSLTQRKAQILKSRLDRATAIRESGVRTPWIQPKGNKLLLSNTTGKYKRSGKSTGSSLHTSITPLPFTHNAPRMSRAGVEISAKVVAADEFEDQIKNCLEYRAIDRLFLEALKKTVKDMKINSKLVYAADKEGPEGPAWANLRKLAISVADTVARDILPPKEPLLLTQPGLIDRYQLVGFLKKVVAAAQDDDAQATILLVPGHEGGIPRIEGRTEIPGLLPGQNLRLSRSWLVAQQIK